MSFPPFNQPWLNYIYPDEDYQQKKAKIMNHPDPSLDKGWTVVE